MLGALDEPNRITAIIYAILYLLLTPPFVYFRHKDPIKSRGWLLTLIQNSVVLIDVIIRALGFGILLCPVEYIRYFVLQPLWMLPYFLRCMILWWHFSLQMSLIKADQVSLKARFLKAVKRRPWVVSNWFQVVFCLTIFVFFSAVGLAVGYGFPPIPQAEKCLPQQGFWVALVIGVIILALALLMLWMLWSVRDSYLIRKEVGLLFGVGFPLFVVWGVAQTLRWTNPAPAVFLDTVEVWFMVVTYALPLAGVFHFRRLMKTRKIRTSTSIEMNKFDELEEILADPELEPAFEKFAISTWSVENLLFHRRVKEYRQVADSKLLEDAKNIFRKFLAEGSYCEINIDMALKESIWERIEEEAIDRTLFDLADDHTMNLMRYSLIPLWKNTSELREILSKRGLESLAGLQSKSTSSANLLA